MSLANLGIATGDPSQTGFAVQFTRPAEADTIKLLSFAKPGVAFELEVSVTNRLDSFDGLKTEARSVSPRCFCEIIIVCRGNPLSNKSERFQQELTKALHFVFGFHKIERLEVLVTNHLHSFDRWKTNPNGIKNLS